MTETHKLNTESTVIRSISEIEIYSGEFILTNAEVKTLKLETFKDPVWVPGLFNGKPQHKFYFIPDNNALDGFADFYLDHQVYPDQFQLSIAPAIHLDKTALEVRLVQVDSLLIEWTSALEQMSKDFDLRLGKLWLELKK